MKLWGILFTAAALALTAPAQAAVHTTTALLDVDQVVGTVNGTTTASGSADITYDDVTNELSWEITYMDLTSTVLAAHFHGPAARGVDAGSIITINDLSSPMQGTATLTTQAQEDQLLGGLWYINIHTTTNSGGEIRGQVEFAAADAGADAAPAEGGADAATDGAAPMDASMDGAVSDAAEDAPPVTDAGGAGGAAGGSGGATGGRGGTTATGGSAGRGGTTATGGSPSTTGGTAGTAPVDAGDGGGSSEDDDGCGCSVPGGRTSSGAMLASLALLGLATARRRRRS